MVADWIGSAAEWDHVLCALELGAYIGFCDLVHDFRASWQ